MESIGKYKVFKQLGAGGFGAVYLCHDEKIKRDVAIKVFKPKDDTIVAFATSSDKEGLQVLQQRFNHEAQILGELDDCPYIIAVLEFGELEDGSPFYVMPYVPRSLADELGKDKFDSGSLSELSEHEKPKALPLERALTVLEQILEGLAAAHSKELVHRDIKPANILLNEKGEIRIADFGIAKSPGNQHTTVSQLGMGSLKYMAPEQMESAKHVDARADVYSFGVLAYRILTGKLPGMRLVEPNVAVPQLGKALNDLILDTLEENKEQRPLDASVVLGRFIKAKQQLGDTSNSETATFTDISDNRSQSVIPQRLRPLAALIEDSLIEHGNLHVKQSEMNAMAMGKKGGH